MNILEDMIGTVSALQVASLAVEEMGEKDPLPEEIHFISRFKEGAMKVNQSMWATWAIGKRFPMRKKNPLSESDPPGGAGAT